ncbi:cytidyltransferase-related domain protein, partial [mine drainage metagenome]
WSWLSPATGRPVGVKGEPYLPEEDRRIMVDALKPVDRAVLGSTTDIYVTVVELRPQVIALGFNQHWDEGEIARECARRGVPVRVVRIGPRPGEELASRRIVDRILQRASESAR